MIKRYNQTASPLRHAAPYVVLAVLAGIALALAIFCLGLGVATSRYKVVAGMSIAMGKTAIVLAIIAVSLFAAAVIIYKAIPDEVHIQAMVQRALWHPSHGNPLRLRTGELLPRVRCERVGEGIFEVTVYARGVTVEAIADAVSAISSALSGRFARYAITQTDADVAFISHRGCDDRPSDHSV